MSLVGPKRCTSPELTKYGVDLVDFVRVKLQCRHCATIWSPEHDRGQLVKNYWQCPNRCNKSVSPGESATR
jgi:hypothetical protein